MGVEVGHVKELFFLSRIPFCLIEKEPLIYEQHGAKNGYFQQKCHKIYKMATFDSL